MPPYCPDGCLDGIERPEDMELITIKVNIHYLQDANGGGNFDLQPGPTNGIDRAQSLISQMNQLLSNMPPVVPQNASTISDARIRFVLHSDPANHPLDLHGGVWFHENHPDFGNCESFLSTALKNAHSEYGPEVVDLFYNECSVGATPGSGTCFKGSTNGISSSQICGMFGITVQGIPDGSTGSTYDRVSSHEILHMLTLPHSFQCSPLQPIDIDAAGECNNNGGCGNHLGSNCDYINALGSNNIMGYGGAPVSLSPCQVAQARRFILDNRPAYAIITPAQQNGGSDIVIGNGEDETWTFQRDLDGNVTIEDGGKLTIRTTVTMAEAKRITVERGGQLVLDCAHLRPRDADKFWEGIIVQGAPGPQAFFQGASFAGWCTINNSIVEQAVVGVRVFDPSSSIYSGGVVQAMESHFLNCKWRAVEFSPFQNTNLNGQPAGNLSRFTLCEFELNGDYPADFAFFQEMAYLDGVDGVRFLGCGFANAFPHTQAYASGRKYGIRARNAGYRVDAHCLDNPQSPTCADWARSRFSGFAYGIFNGVYSNARPFAVSRTDFSDNFVGIYASRTPMADITRCFFEVGSTLPTGAQATNNGNRGIHLYRCNGYRVEGNYLTTNTASLAGTTSPVGILVQASGEDPNVVYRNTLDELLVGNLSNGKNRNLFDLDVGLQYLCNTNLANTFDFAVPEEAGNDKGVAARQGSAQEAAGNSFSAVTVGADPEMHFLNREAVLTYFTPPPPTNYTIATIALSVSPPGECPSNLPGDDRDEFMSETEKQQLQQEFGGSGSSIEKAQIADQLVRYYLADGTGQNLDTARIWLANKGTLEAHFTIVETYLQEGDATGAQQALGNIPSQFALSGESQTEYNHFNTLKGMQIAALQNGTSDADMVSTNQTALDSLANAGNYYASVQTQNLLNEVNGLTYLPDVTLPSAGQQGLLAPPPSGQAESVTNQVMAVPNPAKDLTVFRYSLEETAVNPRLVVKALDGRTVWQAQLPTGKGEVSWELGALADGLYLFSLEVDGKNVVTDKLVIVR